MSLPEFKELTVKNLRSKAAKELPPLLQALREKQRELRFSINAKQLKDIRSLRQVKKIIARILTILKTKK